MIELVLPALASMMTGADGSEKIEQFVNCLI